jgi:hypothetical protein
MMPSDNDGYEDDDEYDYYDTDDAASDDAGSDAYDDGYYDTDDGGGTSRDASADDAAAVPDIDEPQWARTRSDAQLHLVCQAVGVDVAADASRADLIRRCDVRAATRDNLSLPELARLCSDPTVAYDADALVACVTNDRVRRLTEALGVRTEDDAIDMLDRSNLSDETKQLLLDFHRASHAEFAAYANKEAAVAQAAASDPLMAFLTRFGNNFVGLLRNKVNMFMSLAKGMTPPTEGISWATATAEGTREVDAIQAANEAAEKVTAAKTTSKGSKKSGKVAKAWRGVKKTLGDGVRHAKAAAAKYLPMLANASMTLLAKAFEWVGTLLKLGWSVLQIFFAAIKWLASYGFSIYEWFMRDPLRAKMTLWIYVQVKNELCYQLGRLYRWTSPRPDTDTAPDTSSTGIRRSLLGTAMEGFQMTLYDAVGKYVQSGKMTTALSTGLKPMLEAGVTAGVTLLMAKFTGPVALALGPVIGKAITTAVNMVVDVGCEAAEMAAEYVVLQNNIKECMRLIVELITSDCFGRYDAAVAADEAKLENDARYVVNDKDGRLLDEILDSGATEAERTAARQRVDDYARRAVEYDNASYLTRPSCDETCQKELRIGRQVVARRRRDLMRRTQRKEKGSRLARLDASEDAWLASIPAEAETTDGDVRRRVDDMFLREPGRLRDLERKYVDYAKAKKEGKDDPDIGFCDSACQRELELGRASIALKQAVRRELPPSLEGLAPVPEVKDAAVLDAVNTILRDDPSRLAYYERLYLESKDWSVWRRTTCTASCQRELDIGQAALHDRQRYGTK